MLDIVAALKSAPGKASSVREEKPANAGDAQSFAHHLQAQGANRSEPPRSASAASTSSASEANRRDEQTAKADAEDKARAVSNREAAADQNTSSVQRGSETKAEGKDKDKKHEPVETDAKPSTATPDGTQVANDKTGNSDLTLLQSAKGKDKGSDDGAKKNEDDGKDLQASPLVDVDTLAQANSPTVHSVVSAAVTPDKLVEVSADAHADKDLLLNSRSKANIPVAGHSQLDDSAQSGSSKLALQYSVNGKDPIALDADKVAGDEVAIAQAMKSDNASTPALQQFSKLLEGKDPLQVPAQNVLSGKEMVSSLDKSMLGLKMKIARDARADTITPGELKGSDSSSAPALSDASIAQQYNRSGALQTPDKMTLNVSFGRAEWQAAVGDKVAQMAAKNLSFAEIQLDPPELGSLHVRVHMHNDSASVSFSSASPMVRDALEQTQPRLRELFHSEGLHLLDVNVSDGGGQRQTGQQAGTGSGRRASASALIEEAVEPAPTLRLANSGFETFA